MAKWMAKNDQANQKQTAEVIQDATKVLHNSLKMMQENDYGGEEAADVLKETATGLLDAVEVELEPTEEASIADALHTRAELKDASKDDEADDVSLLGKADADHDMKLLSAMDSAIAATENTKASAATDGALPSGIPVIYAVDGKIQQVPEEESNGADEEDATSDADAALAELLTNNAKAATKLAAEAAGIRVKARDGIRATVSTYADTLASQDVPLAPTNSTPIGFLGR